MPPIWEFDPTSIEQAVQSAARGSASRERELRRVLDPIYALPMGRERAARFAGAFADRFVGWELSRPIEAEVARRPILIERLDRALVRPSPARKLESAELFVGFAAGGDRPTSPRRTLVVAICASTLLDPAAPSWRRIRRELLQAADMLDERFAYRPETPPGLPMQRNLTIDRHRALWDVWAEARLIDEDPSAPNESIETRARFDRAFAGAAASTLDRAHASIASAESLAHERIMTWACEPKTLLGVEPGDPAARASRRGEPCSLCGFPTHDWFDFQADATGAAERIATERADWTALDGACRQCVELYRALAPTR
jgi:hypothetical protein